MSPKTAFARLVHPAPVKKTASTPQIVTHLSATPPMRKAAEKSAVSKYTEQLSSVDEHFEAAIEGLENGDIELEDLAD